MRKSCFECLQTFLIRSKGGDTLAPGLGKEWFLSTFYSYFTFMYPKLLEKEGVLIVSSSMGINSVGSLQRGIFSWQIKLLSEAWSVRLWSSQCNAVIYGYFITRQKQGFCFIMIEFLVRQVNPFIQPQEFIFSFLEQNCFTDSNMWGHRGVLNNDARGLLQQCFGIIRV